MDQEITVAIIGVSGPIVAALLALIGIFAQRNLMCGCCGRGATDSSNNDNAAPEPTPEPAHVSTPTPEHVSAPAPTPVETYKKCQILDTRLSSFLGIIKVNKSNCYTNKKKCPHCNKVFCEYHYWPNNHGEAG